MGRTIEIKARDGHSLSAYQANPNGSPKGGLVVIQEIFGVNKHIRELCDSFAEDGYVAIAPALFDRIEKDVDLGYEEDDRQKGIELRGQIDWEDNLLDAIAAKETISEVRKIGAIGYCFGGTVAWLCACSGEFDAASGYYGGFIHTFLDLEAKCPVELHFGAQDQSIPQENVEKIKISKPTADIYVYQNAGHGFVCDHRASYDELATIKSRERTLSFFGNSL